MAAASGVCELLTRISTDLSDVFSDISEVTSHKAAVILAVDVTPKERDESSSRDQIPPGYVRLNALLF